MTAFGSEPHHYSTSDAGRSAYLGLMLGGAISDHEPDPGPHPAGAAGECWTNALALVRRNQDSSTSRASSGADRISPGKCTLTPSTTGPVT